jgi:hypothetical protein
LTDTSQKYSFVNQLHNFVRTKTADNQQNQPKTIQGHVSKILPNDFLEFTIDATGPFTLPIIKIPQAFSKYHREPTQIGDKGYAVPNDYYVGGESGDSGGTANMYQRGNLATHIFHPISAQSFPTRDQNNFLITGGPTGITAQSADTKTNINIDYAQGKDSLIHNAVKDMLHTAGIGGSGNIQHILQGAGNIEHTIQQAGSIIHTVKEGNISHFIQQTGNIINSTTQGNITNIADLGSITSLAQSISMGAGIIVATDGTTRLAPTTVSIEGDLNCSGNISGVPSGLANAPQTVAGSIADGTALTSLLAALVTLGLILDNTSP